MNSIAFTKGHGTQNDFVLIDDSANDLDLGADLVAKLADRRAGLGADGVIRVVRSADIAEGAAVLAENPQALWFMDYRNADGSIAQMCGNGVRVFAAFLEELGLVDFALDAEIAIGTRAGVRTVRRDGDWFTVGMGNWSFPFESEAERIGMDSTVMIEGISGVGADDVRPALSIDMGNPHTVVALATSEELALVDFSSIPDVQPVPIEGTNVEAVVPLPAFLDSSGQSVGHLIMRVHERGVGETKSCGTGACAAAIAVRHWSRQAAGEQAHLVPDTWLVDVPGGQVRVRVDGQAVELSGPAVLLAKGTVELNKLI